MRKLLLILLVVSLLIGCDKPKVISPAAEDESAGRAGGLAAGRATTEEVAAETVEQDRQA